VDDGDGDHEFQLALADGPGHSGEVCVLIK
jgi:hypothetical protein